MIHPTDRRQRLQLKRKKYEEKQHPSSSGGQRKRAKEELKSKEAEDAVKDYRHGNFAGERD